MIAVAVLTDIFADIVAEEVAGIILAARTTGALKQHIVITPSPLPRLIACFGVVIGHQIVHLVTGKSVEVCRGEGIPFTEIDH